MTEEKLFEMLARREQRAFEEICRRYGARMAGMARKQLGQALRARMETADVVQTVLGELLKSAGRVRFDSERAFLRWISVVVERKVLKAARYWKSPRRSPDRARPLPEGMAISDKRAETPTRIFERKETSAQFSRAMARLPHVDRQLIIARVFLQLPWTAVASMLGTREEAAQMRFTRAKRRLASLLGRPGAAGG